MRCRGQILEGKVASTSITAVSNKLGEHDVRDKMHVFNMLVTM